MSLVDSRLLSFLRPRGVAIIGASADPAKLGYGVARNLVASGYPGATYMVSLHEGEVFGHAIYPDLESVPDPVDLAVIVVPAPAVPEILRACAGRGIRSAIVSSAGFREVGPEGASLEAECVEIAGREGIRILGPNCIGTVDTFLPLDTTFLQPPIPSQGAIAFLSHSGAFCAAIIDWSRGEGFGFSQIVSLGNQADVTEADMLPLLAQDAHSRAVVMYLETVVHGRRLVDAARLVARAKPVVAFKVGRSEAGKRAAASHTAALAGSDSAFRAACDKAGIHRAATAEEAFDWARALAACPLPRGRRVAVLTNAGGPGVIAADAISMHGLELSHISTNTRQLLAAHLPTAASLQNPVDMLASATPEHYGACLHILLEDDNVDSVLLILPPPPLYNALAVAEKIIPLIEAADKPIVIALMGSELVREASARFARAGVPSFPFPERAVSALRVLVDRGEALEALAGEPLRPSYLGSTASSSALDILEAYGIPTEPIQLAASPREATEVAAKIGYPVVMKVASDQISHKSDVNGVLLHISTPEEVVRGYAQILRAVATLQPNAKVDGVHLQHEADAGQDVIIGLVQDPGFGPVIMFGSGGVEAEALGDVAFALPPLTAAEAKKLIERTWAGRRLRGYRSIAPADAGAVLDAIVRFSWLVVEHDEFEELEINPLRVLPSGVRALDVRVQRRHG